jgi:2-polyprenyl-6-methoxyphenol hydroxylase-like FAD-dependent oxidoreductase
MQFHLNGFRPGDPTVSDAARTAAAAPAKGRRPAAVDVLIVGCGPTGLTLAAQLAAFPEIRTRIFEQKSGPLEVGQADGINCRTMEMFEAFGFAERIATEAYWVNETCFWVPDPKDPQRIIHSRVLQDVEDGLSEFPHVILNQARVHDHFLELMKNGAAPIEPDYSKRIVDLQVDQKTLGDPAAYPVTARFEKLEGPRAGSIEVVRARYLVGCDGARSAVRGFMGYALAGDSANQAWGVMDIMGVSDFPDIRRKAAIQSAEEGSVLIIPREGGYMVRMYVELDKLAENQRVASLNVDADYLIAAARRILRPYTLEVKEVAWWSVYEIGHRLCERFDDRPEGAGSERFPRLFIAGDACHTHSPKAGQGMNVSMQDTFNLGWKLAAVLRGRASTRLLGTYQEERRGTARALVETDHKWARMLGARPKISANGDGVDPRELQEHFIRQLIFTSGTATHYEPGLLTGATTHQSLAQGFVIGTRFHSAPVVRLADAKPMHLGHVARADGRWRLYAFADRSAPTDRHARLWRLCEYLEHSAESPMRRYRRAGEDVDAVFELIAICQQAHRSLTVTGLPPLLVPRKGRYRLIDYEKVYCPDFKSGAHIFDVRRIDRERGALVVVRPDQYVAQVLPLEAHAELSRSFESFMTS